MDTSPPSIPNDFRRWSQNSVFTPSEPFLANRIPFCILRSLCGDQRGESCAYFRSGIMSDGKFGRLPSNLEHSFCACRTRENRRDTDLQERLNNRSSREPFRSYEKYEECSWHFTHNILWFHAYISINELSNDRPVFYNSIYTLSDFLKLSLLFSY